MKAFQNPFKRRSKPLPRNLAERFLHLFDAHNVHRSQIPRLIQQIKPADLQSEARLLDALTVEVIDATAHLFGVRREWLDGLDDLMLYPIWEGNNPKGFLARLAAVVAAAPTGPGAWSPAPLRVLTTSMRLDRDSSTYQALLPVMVTQISDQQDSPVYRCQVSGDCYEWADTQSRLELKAITWLVSQRLKTIVPMFQVTEDELQNICSGTTIPSMVLGKRLITSPSLEDFVQSKEESMVAKETDELPALISYLEAQGLQDFTFETSPAVATPSEIDILQHLPAALVPPVDKESEGKRDTAKVQWDEVRTYVKALRTTNPELNKTEMATSLLTAPDLRLPSHREDTIRRHIADLWHDPESKKPGRRRKEST